MAKTKNQFKNFFINRDFSKMSPKNFKKTASLVGIFLLVLFIFFCFEVYVPFNSNSHESIVYAAKKGMGDDEIAKDLQKLGIIRSNWFFRFYVVASLQHSKLQAGRYTLSPKMSVYQIAKKMIQGEAIQETLFIPEGWDLRDIGKYLESKNICKKEEFLESAKADLSNDFDFLKDKPKDIGLEGYLFPDTYQISGTESCSDIIIMMLENFNKKLTPELRNQISSQKKSIFEVVTMASMIEKEVRSLTDKKIVSGILWKRLSVGMPLQLDSTVNYITDGNDPAVSIKATKIDSPYNTYKYKGLPKGPISNPGMDSIIAALSPTKTAYWFYLSDGITRYAKTDEEHAANKAKYLN